MSDTKKMKPSVKKKWVEALRSGEFQQASGKLCDGGNGYCCLGVLSELAYREGKTDKWEGGGGSIFYGKGRGSFSTGFTPTSVVRWAGLPDDDPVVEYEGEPSDLASLNDNGFTFEQIADLIEAQL